MVKMQAIGHLGKDCVVNDVNGKKVINFSVAHSEKFKDAKGVEKEKTLWVECAYWSDKTGIGQYLTKGQQVYVDGSPDVRTYTTANGQTGASLVLRVSQIQLVGGVKNKEDKYASINNQTERNYATAPQDVVTDADDLPF